MTVEDRYPDFERRIRASFLTFNAEVSRQLQQFVTEEFIDYNAIQTGYRPLARKFSADLVNVMILGANLSAQEAADQLGSALAFNPAGFTAAQTFQELNARVIGILVEQQNEAIFEMRRIANTITPIRTAAMVRDGLTLTGRQVKAVDNFRRMLEENSSESLTRELRDHRFDGTIRRAIAAGKPLSIDEIDKMVHRYNERYITFRANTIAATEAVRIANEADDLFYRQALEEGDLGADQVFRKWVTSKDEKVRSSHRAIDEVVNPVGQPWVSGDGNSLRFPGDPRAPARDTINCRCWVSTEIKENEVSQSIAA